MKIVNMQGVHLMNNLDLLMNEINKKFKEDIVVKGTNIIYSERIPFSSPRANYLLYGGIPVGKAVEFFGSEGSGKTTTALDCVGQAQKKALREYNEALDKMETELEELQAKNNKSDQKRIQQLQQGIDNLEEQGPKKAVYVDAENTLDEEWARLNGVDTDNLYLIRPQSQTAEQVLQMVIDIIKSGNVCIVVVDSIPMLVPQQLYEETLEKKSYCGIAGTMAQFASRVPPLLNKNKCTLIMINQVREDIDNPYNLYKTPGGKALKHLYAVRILFRKGVFITEDNQELANNKATEPAGNLVNMDIAKTKICRPDRRMGFYTLKYKTGVDVLADTVDLAIKYDIIRQSGAWFNILDVETGEIMCDENDEPLKFQGRPKLLEYLRSEPIVFNDIARQVNKLISE